MQFDLTIGGKTARSKTGQHAASINWNEVPDEAQEFIIRYGLKQYLADGMAGAENVQQAADGVAERVRKIMEADFARARGEPSSKPDSIEARALKIAKGKVRDTAKARKVKLDKDQVQAAAEAWLKRDPTQFMELAAKEIEAEEATRAALEDSEDIFDILGLNDAADEVEGDEEEETSDED